MRYFTILLCLSSLWMHVHAGDADRFVVRYLTAAESAERRRAADNLMVIHVFGEPIRRWVYDSPVQAVSTCDDREPMAAQSCIK